MQDVSAIAELFVKYFDYYSENPFPLASSSVTATE